MSEFKKESKQANEEVQEEQVEPRVPLSEQAESVIGTLMENLVSELWTGFQDAPNNGQYHLPQAVLDQVRAAQIKLFDAASDERVSMPRVVSGGVRAVRGRQRRRPSAPTSRIVQAFMDNNRDQILQLVISEGRLIQGGDNAVSFFVGV